MRMKNNEIDHESILMEYFGPDWSGRPGLTDSTITTNMIQFTDTVITKSGKIKGHVKSINDDKKIYSFKKIPYAEPPLGDLRFARPHPVKPWKDILDVSNGPESPMSVQVPALSPDSKYIIGQEDCLYLNVYVPENGLNSALWTDGCNPNIPVIIWIHGGAFCIGSNDGQIYGPEILLKNDVILVTINYR